MNIRVAPASHVHVDDVPPSSEPEAKAPMLGEPLSARASGGDGGPEGGADPRPVAVFVAHGMGQQLSFSTLEAAAQGVRDSLLRIPADGEAPSEAFRYHEDQIGLTARNIRLGDARTPTVEMTVEGDDAPPPIHFYEGYWAPLTEGQVTLRDVMRFLYVAAWNGLRKGVGQPIERYMFGHTALHNIRWSTFLGLLVTALALGSLVLLNAVIAGVVVDASYGVLADGSATAIGDGTLPGALTTLVASYLGVTLAFGLLLGLAAATAGPTYAAGGPGPVRRVVYGGLFALFFGWLLATLAAGVGTLAVLLHATGVALPEAGWLWGILIASFAAALAAGGASWGHGRSLMAGYRAHVAKHAGAEPLPDFGERPLSGGRLAAVTVALVASVVVAVACAVALLAPAAPRLAEQAPATWGTPVRMATWVLLFGVSGLIRNLLVQYFGDVAAYISPHTLDRFASLRRAIRDASVRVLRGVYHARGDDGRPRYAGVAVVGHSLGSVVAYDALNRVLAEDDAAESETKGSGVEVRERTRLLLTFGSPLDKTAYIFRAQNQSLSKVREALANAVQPLILETETRTFPWINVHSTRDVIGSALDLYDLPDAKAVQKARAQGLRAECVGPGYGHEVRVATGALDGAHCPFCVHDVADPGARIPLIAHNEHWKTWAVFDVLVAALTGGAGAHAAAVHEAATRAEAD